MDNIDKDAKIASDFTEEFNRQQIVGLPALSLEKHGGPPVIPPTRQRGQSAKGFRSHTSMSVYDRKTTKDRVPRMSSAPAVPRDSRPVPAIKISGDSRVGKGGEEKGSGDKVRRKKSEMK
ncbi:putative ankyrin and armadillo repeat-containing protein [Apostichopus japonicus]|uniref:Putative ankyrin and armadillo repeat-containing protein n=1 Tax=Stichopus japonicus TaxID=307972 RepID=A0A2G8JZU9_STIJA|nr:putative ankyrin and armadillo repeat-containing protein [Apostichopus japonicus]